LGWIARGVLIIAGIVTSWFLAEDAWSYPVWQMVIAMLLIVFIVGILALPRRR
jgi:hypothetical protein